QRVNRLAIRPCTEEGGHACELLGIEHSLLREGELKDRIGLRIFPVDEMVDDIVVHPKGENAGHHLHGKNLLGWKSLGRSDVRALCCRIDLEGPSFTSTGDRQDLA